jgi:pimeloyl-ACP methyl ester carboxylesterase
LVPRIQPVEMNFKLILVFLISNVHSQIFDSLEVIEKFGYKGARYQFLTADGYLLKIQRIFSNKFIQTKKSPCLIVHGFFSLSLQFLQLQNNSLPFILADNGHDVFLGNVRGTKYSSHVTYPRNSSEFWNFSLHEIGYYDLPAMIDGVLKITRSKKLFYIGLSQGTAVSTILMSTRPEYNEKIIEAHYLGPAIFLGYKSNIFSIPDLGLYTRHDMIDFSDVVDIIRPFYMRFCDKNNPLLFILCLLQEFTFFGFNINTVEVDLDVLKYYADTHAPAASKRQYDHFKQLAKSRKFQYFDYGDKNIRIYGSENPPEYDLRRVTIPIYVYWGSQDDIIRKEVSNFKG